MLYRQHNLAIKDHPFSTETIQTKCIRRNDTILMVSYEYNVTNIIIKQIIVKTLPIKCMRCVKFSAEIKMLNSPRNKFCQL